MTQDHRKRLPRLRKLGRRTVKLAAIGGIVYGTVAALSWWTRPAGTTPTSERQQEQRSRWGTP